MNYAAHHPVSRVPDNVRLLKTTGLLKAAKNMVQNKKGRPMNLAATFPFPLPLSPRFLTKSHYSRGILLRGVVAFLILVFSFLFSRAREFLSSVRRPFRFL